MYKENFTNGSKFFANGVGLLTSGSGKEFDVMACEWTFNVSYNPFLVAVLVNPKHYTYKLLLRNPEFGITVASVEQAALTHFAGTSTGSTTDKFKQFRIHLLKSKHIKPPLIKGGVFSAECKVVKKVKIGDHVMFVGKVVRCLTDESKQPLLYRSGKFHHLGKKINRKK